MAKQPTPEQLKEQQRRASAATLRRIQREKEAQKKAHEEHKLKKMVEAKVHSAIVMGERRERLREMMELRRKADQMAKEQLAKKR